MVRTEMATGDWREERGMRGNHAESVEKMRVVLTGFTGLRANARDTKNTGTRVCLHIQTKLCCATPVSLVSVNCFSFAGAVMQPLYNNR